MQSYKPPSYFGDICARNVEESDVAFECGYKKSVRIQCVKITKS